jgi:hypothetical protein
MKKPIHAQPSKSLAPPWQQSEPTYTVGKSHIDGMDHVAHGMERRWGVGRLRLLVDADLRARFDTQQQKVNQAIWHGELDEVIAETKRMCNAWNKLDHVAEVELGAEHLSPQVWEMKLPNGKIAAVVKDSAAAWHVTRFVKGRPVAIYTLEQIARIIDEAEQRALSENHGAHGSRSNGPASHIEVIHDKSGEWEDPIPF